MKAYRSAGWLVLVALALFGAPQDGMAQRADSAAVEDLRRQVDALAREIEALRLGQDVVPRADTAAYGLGPAAAKVYQVRQGVSLGGYGEVLYENYAGERDDGTTVGLPRDQVDFLRAIVYVGYRFTDRLLFNSEFEFEHASTGSGGSASVEFAYIDYLHSDAFNVRGGMVLVPMGFVNELHEPPVFLGANRSLSESLIIPSTWRENGVGVFGTSGDLDYRAYLINGLDGVGNGPSRAGGFGATGLRGGRQKGARALIETPAIVARVDYTPSSLLAGLSVGGSAYRGNSANAAEFGGETIDAVTTIIEAHAQYRAAGIDVSGLFVNATVGDVARLNAARGLGGSASIGETLRGWYLQGGYDLFARRATSHEVMPYVRFEAVDTQVEVPATFSESPATDRTVTTLGVQWKPIMNIVLKADYELHSNEAGTGLDQFNIVLGWLF